MTPTASPPHAFRTVWWFALARLAGNTFLRFPFLFITPIAGGLHTDIATVTALLGVRELGGLAAPVFGRFNDDGHAKVALAWGAVVASVACMAAPFGSNRWWFVAAITVAGVAKVGIDVIQIAWIGGHLRDHDRTRATALLEVSWAGGFLLGAPILGVVIQHAGWQWSFVACGAVIAVLGLLATRHVADRDQHLAAAVHQHGEHSTDAHVRSRWFRPAMLAYCMTQPAAQVMLFGVVGDWFAVNFSMSSQAIGLATIALGVGELGATIATIWVVRRFGDERSAIAGMVLVLPASLALLAVSSSFGLALCAILVVDIGLELSFVTAVAMLSDMLPLQRGKAVGQAFAVLTISRAIGSAVAGRIYAAGDFGGSAIATTVLSSVCALALWLGTRTSHHQLDPRAAHVG